MHQLDIGIQTAAGRYPHVTVPPNVHEQDRVALLITNGFPLGDVVEVVLGDPGVDALVPDLPDTHRGWYVLAEIRMSGGARARAWQSTHFIDPDELPAGPGRHALPAGAE